MTPPKSLEAWVPNTSSTCLFIRANLDTEDREIKTPTNQPLQLWTILQAELRQAVTYLPWVNRNRNFQYEGLRFWTSITA